MINDFDVILYYLMGGIEVNRCMERERESFFVFFFKVKLGILLIQFFDIGIVFFYFGVVFIVWLICQVDLFLDLEVCESYELIFVLVIVLYS